MEDTLRVHITLQLIAVTAVLILVLMEDTLRALLLWVIAGLCVVLILVLMEDTLRGLASLLKITNKKS